MASVKIADLKRLAEPFHRDGVEWKVQSLDKHKKWVLLCCYVTSRAIMNRLDDVCGAQNWQNTFRRGPDGGVLCGISIKVGDEWITKWDGACNTPGDGSPNALSNAIKGGLSSAMKRCGSQWGIGRYLYGLDAAFANPSAKGSIKGAWGDRTRFQVDPPSLPKWALPGGSGSPGNERHIVGPEEAAGEESLPEPPAAVPAGGAALKPQGAKSDTEAAASRPEKMDTSDPSDQFAKANNWLLGLTEVQKLVEATPMIIASTKYSLKEKDALKLVVAFRIEELSRA